MLRYLQLAFIILLIGCSPPSVDDRWSETSEKGKFVDYFRFALMYEDSDYLGMAYDSLTVLLNHDSIYRAIYYDDPDFVGNIEEGFFLYVVDPYEGIGHILRRNVFIISIDKTNTILFNGQDLKKGELKSRIKDFLINPNSDESLSEQQLHSIPLLGERKLSKGSIDIRGEFDDIDSGLPTSWEHYFDVFWKVRSIYTELREEASEVEFGKPFKKLSVEEQNSIKKLIGFYCSFGFRHNRR